MSSGKKGPKGQHWRWRKPTGLRLCAQALRDNVLNPTRWVLDQAVWNGDPPSRRTVLKWFQCLEGSNIDLMALHGLNPPTRMTLSQRRDAQHHRLAEHIQRLVIELRELEQDYARDVAAAEDEDDGQKRIAELRAAYHGSLATLNRSYIDVEREYRMSLTGVTREDLSDRDLRGEIVGSLIEAAGEFDAGEAERIIQALSSVRGDGDDNDDVL